MTEIMQKLEEIGKDTANTRVKVARIEEHIKNLNGSVQRHENNIDDLYTKYGKNKTTLDKIWGGIGVIGIIAGTVGTFIFNLIAKIWR